MPKPPNHAPAPQAIEQVKPSPKVRAVKDQVEKLYLKAIEGANPLLANVLEHAYDVAMESNKIKDIVFFLEYLRDTIDGKLGTDSSSSGDGSTQLTINIGTRFAPQPKQISDEKDLDEAIDAEVVNGNS